MSKTKESRKSSAQAKSKEDPAEHSEEERVLIVGDWVVDEYWQLVRHHSDISSHIGFSHYRSTSTESSGPSNSKPALMDLCGAGHVARVARQILEDREEEEKKPERWKIWGLGTWHDKDEDHIEALLDGKGNCNTRRAFLVPERESQPRKIPLELINIDPRSGQTTRVIRMFNYTGEGVEQISRIDWGAPPEANQNPETPSEPTLSTKPKGLPKNINTIIVHDLRKGVVDTSLIKFLRDEYPDAEWFVRSKQLNPPWLGLIGDHIKLLLIGPEILSLRNPWRQWQVDNKITYLAFELLSEMSGETIVLLSDHREIIALVDHHRTCLMTKGTRDVSPLSQIGWSSAFFASLTCRIKIEDTSISETSIETAINDANTHRTPLAGLDSKTSLPKYPIERKDWTVEVRKWKDAQRQHGILNDDPRSSDGDDDPRSSDGDDDPRSSDGERTLEVWRGCKSLPGYVACVREKVEIINTIGQHLRTFGTGENAVRSIGILLQADPGTGKTFLAKSLAKVFNFSFLKWDITQMVERSDLLDLFDSVATEQANQQRPILVFVDEINAILAGSHVYGAFLAPLEEGSYIRRGNAFNLRPCVWIFAGTDLSSASGDQGEKVEDFVARMTMIARFDFASLKKKRKDATVGDDARLEQVYLGASFIRELYPDVTHVSKSILSVFHDLNPADSPARKIRNRIMMLRNVQYGKILGSNCREWSEVVENGVKLKDYPLVRLVFTKSSEEDFDAHENRPGFARQNRPTSAAVLARANPPDPDFGGSEGLSRPRSAVGKP